MRSALSAALVVLSGCAAESPRIAGGSFCGQLRHIITQGESGFIEKGIAGAPFTSPRIYGDYSLYAATIKLPDFQRCIVSADASANAGSRRSVKYICVATDSTVTSDDDMHRDFDQLNAKVSACLVDSKWPGYLDDLGDSVRYHRSVRGGYNLFETYLDHKDASMDVYVAVVRGLNAKQNPLHLNRMDGFGAPSNTLVIAVEEDK